MNVNSLTVTSTKYIKKEDIPFGGNWEFGMALEMGHLKVNDVVIKADVELKKGDVVKFRDKVISVFGVEVRDLRD